MICWDYNIRESVWITIQYLPDREVFSLRVLLLHMLKKFGCTGGIGILPQTPNQLIITPDREVFLPRVLLLHMLKKLGWENQIIITPIGKCFCQGCYRYLC